ncbi:MAG: tetratricopeptide repeat protein [Thiolinea sp.]
MLDPRDVESFQTAATEADSAYALTVLGEAATARENFTSAEHYYRDAIARNPDIAQAYFGLGEIHQKQNQPDAALDGYRAPERAPQNRRFLLNLASVYAERGQLPEAEIHYRQVLALDDSVLLAYIELGQVLEQRQKFAEARELAQQAMQGLEQHPDWKDKPLNAQEWFILQDGQPFYLSSWEDKTAYLQAWLERVGD